VRSDVTQATSEALLAAMTKRPDDRFPTYGDFQMALEGARSLLLVHMMRQQQSGDTSPGHHRSWWKR
jgi:hypothetical protein